MSEDNDLPGEEQSGLAMTLGPSCFRARNDLTASRHVFRGEVTYVIRDPLTFRTLRLAHPDYALFIRIHSRQTLAEVFEGIVADRLLDREDEEQFYEFVVSLHQRGFLQLPTPERQILYERRKRRQEARAGQRWMSVFFFRVNLFNPDAFLSRTAGRVRPLFTRPAFVVWLLVVAGGLAVALGNSEALAQPLSQVLVADNLPLLLVTLVVLKVVHEFAHAYACKLFGGTVPEMGLNFIVGTPLPYVDASDAWKFPRKRDRIFVSAAGVYVELFLAAIAILVWSASSPGVVKAVAYNAALLASVVTVGFNLNPLMKFDGYFILSDMVEVPNLRERSTKYAMSVLNRWMFGSPSIPFDGGRLARLCLFSFGVACGIYRPLVTLGISAVIASTYFVLGLTLATVYVLVEVGRVAARIWRFLLKSEEVAGKRFRAVFVGAVIFVLLPVGVCFIPVPARAVVPGLVSSLDEVTLRAEAPGFVSVLFAHHSEDVEENAPLVNLEHFEDEAALHDARGRLAQALLHAEALSYQDWITSQLERKRAEHVAREVKWYERENMRRQVRAPRQGRLVEFFVEGDYGRFVPAGEPLAILAAGAPVARLLLTEQEMAEANPVLGRRVSFRPVAAPERTLEGRIVSVQPRGSRLITEEQFTHLAGGIIPVNPLTGEALQPYFEVVIELPEAGASDLPRGARGHALLGVSSRSLLQMGVRCMLRFLQELKRND